MQVESLFGVLQRNYKYEQFTQVKSIFGDLPSSYMHSLRR